MNKHLANLVSIVVCSIGASLISAIPITFLYLKHHGPEWFSKVNEAGERCTSIEAAVSMVILIVGVIATSLCLCSLVEAVAKDLDCGYDDIRRDQLRKEINSVLKESC